MERGGGEVECEVPGVEAGLGVRGGLGVERGVERWILIGIEAPQKESSVCGAWPHRKNFHRKFVFFRKTNDWCIAFSRALLTFCYTPIRFFSDFDSEFSGSGKDWCIANLGRLVYSEFVGLGGGEAGGVRGFPRGEVRGGARGGVEGGVRGGVRDGSEFCSAATS